jgi:hypothetical protein
MTYISGELARLPRLREEVNDLEAFSPNAVRLILVDLRFAHPTIVQPDRGGAFQLSPAPTTILRPQESSDPQSPAFGNHLDISDLAEQFEVHASFLAFEYQIGGVTKMSRK